jgi:MFS family permease
VAYADAYAPEGKKATAQGLFSAVMMGVGSAFGGLLGGYLYDLYGLSKMFHIFGLSSALAIVFLLLFAFQTFRPATTS